MSTKSICTSSTRLPGKPSFSREVDAVVPSERRKETNTMASLAFAFPLRAGKTEEWRAWVREILGPRRSEYEAFSRQLGLKTQRAYLQHTPQGDQAIIYLEGEDLQRTFQQLRTAQDPFTILVRQQTMDLFGVDLTQI